MNNKLKKFSSIVSCYAEHTDYTFDSFVVCEENKCAYNSCLAIADNQRDWRYNVLFIFGDIGLGKTHLLQAIANKVIKDDDCRSVLYISCQELVNEYLNAIKEKQIDEYKDKYLNVDVLLVDDIDILSGKYETQNILFDLFNRIISMNKKIVFTSNKSANKLDGIQDRMISKFCNLLSCNIKMPSVDDRVAILRIIEEKYKLDYKIDDDIVNYIAKNVTSNIRELEGCLNIIIKAMKLKNKLLNINDVKKLLYECGSSSI